MDNEVTTTEKKDNFFSKTWGATKKSFNGLKEAPKETKIAVAATTLVVGGGSFLAGFFTGKGKKKVANTAIPTPTPTEA